MTAEPAGRARRVLVVSHYLPPHVGGIETVAATSATLLADDGHHVVAASTTPVPADGPTAHERVELRAWNGVERRTGVPFPVPGPAALRTLRRQVGRADVVHVHDLLYPTSWLAGWCAARDGKRLVLTQHVHRVEHPSRLVMAVQRLVHATLGRALLRRAHRTSYLNATVADFLAGLGAARQDLQFLPNGVDAEFFRPPGPGEADRVRRRFGLPTDRRLVLFVGRFVPKKGFDLLLAARDPGYLLVMVGGDPPAGWQPDPDVVFLGPRTRTEISELYRACDVFALPSEAEGFPVTVQEAMASGLPVVTGDDPGYGPYGLDPRGVALVPRQPAAIRATLRDLVGDPGRRRAMGSWSRAHARAFGPQAHLAGLRELYGWPTAAEPGVGRQEEWTRVG